MGGGRKWGIWSKGAYGVKGHGSEVDRDGFKTNLAHVVRWVGVRWGQCGVGVGVKWSAWSGMGIWSEGAYGVK